MLYFFRREIQLLSYSAGIADSLDYDEIHQVCNAGVKIGTVGIPVNFQQGNTILVKKKYNLQEKEIIKLSGSPGLHGDCISFHFDESSFAVAGIIEIDSRKIILINTHLTSDPSAAGVNRRLKEIDKLLKLINDHRDFPVIMGGDFNAVIESEEMQTLVTKGGLTDSYHNADSKFAYSWDPERNRNIDYSRFIISSDPAALSEAEYDGIARKIDYIFVNNVFGETPIIDTKIIFDQPVEEIFLSDHYGVAATLDLTALFARKSPVELSELDLLPILSYSSDYGLGYGLKLFFLNQFKNRESLDFTIFNSSDGSKWYRFVFSLPDFELRQRTKYPAAIDLIIDYSLTRDNYFGLGNKSVYADIEKYTNEPVEVKLQLSRGIRSDVILSGGVKFNYIRNFNYDPAGKIASLGGVSSSVSRYFSFYTNIRYDTRNSFINPSKGVVLSGESEYIPDIKLNNTHFGAFLLGACYYYKLFYPNTIMALRMQLNGRIGNDIPLQNLVYAGRGGSLRGYPMSRMADKFGSVITAELRFPVIWRFGGIAGIDASNVWNKLSLISTADWKVSYAAGLRFYFNTFVVRLDAGFSNETSGIYLDFGHIF
jgi:endonuclease/exonuclease/phosphatase family metal-dependent hydrolase